MTARYFSHSPRGFANEITIFAVEKNEVRNWVSWFMATYGCEYPDGHPLEPITRKQAERMLRRDGVSLQTHEEDHEYLSVEHLLDRITTESVKSACRAAIDYRASVEKEQAFEADMDAAYPEFAFVPR